jgi:cytochrome c oxidase subunit 2
MPTTALAASIFDPASPQARAISHLFVVSLGICGAIFAVVAGLAIYNLLRFRWRSGDPNGRQIHGNPRLEIAWTVAPALILVVLFALTVHAMPLADPPLTGPADLQVIGHQWWWEVRYPGSGIVTANEIHIPVGRAISVQLDTTDVLHEFWVPQLTRKMTAMPSAGNHVWMEAEKAGVYEGLCSEFCGTQHAWMRFQVIADSPADYALWERQQLVPPPAPTGAAAQGRELFRTLTCSNCHTVSGITAGAAGPDLTHLASRRFIGARIVPNTAENLRRWLRDPQTVKPGVLMPNFKLTEPQIGELVAYFESLK